MDQILKQIAFLQDAMLQDALLVVGLIAVMILMLGAKREVRRELRKRQKAFDALAARVAALPREAKRMVPPSSPTPEPAVAKPAATNANAAPVLRSRVNLNWRVQALRLLRRGQDVAHVSTALGVSRREVELLIRVHQLASGRVPSRVTVLAELGAGTSNVVQGRSAERGARPFPA
jgi:hypothetical protein